MLAQNSRVFFKTTLSDIFSKCKTDEKLKSLLTFKFDTKNQCIKYENAGTSSHYHEAAFDAFVTAVGFATLLKAKECEQNKASNPEKESK